MAPSPICVDPVTGVLLCLGACVHWPCDEGCPVDAKCAVVTIGLEICIDADRKPLCKLGCWCSIDAHCGASLTCSPEGQCVDPNGVAVCD